MKKIGKMLVVLFMLTIYIPFAYGKDNPPPKKGPGGPPPDPPPEAFEVCEGKSAGDTVQATTPEGHTITGTCEDFNGRLALRPDHPPKGNGNGPKGQGPPPDGSGPGDRKTE